MKTLNAIIVFLCAAHLVAPAYPEKPIKKELTIYEKIKILKPKISDKNARQISEAIGKSCNPHVQSLVVAILFIESSFRADVVSGSGDLGIAQISREWAVLRNLEPERLLRDTDYSVRALTAVLQAKRRWYHYHSKTPSHAEAYKAKVKAAYAKIQGR